MKKIRDSLEIFLANASTSTNETDDSGAIFQDSVCSSDVSNSSIQNNETNKDNSVDQNDKAVTVSKTKKRMIRANSEINNKQLRTSSRIISRQNSS